MISNDIDLERARRTLATIGRAQVPEFLQAAAAEQIHACLRDEVPWEINERNRPPVTVAGLADEASLMRSAYATAAEGFHFAYDRYHMMEALRDGRDPQLLLHPVLRFLNSPEFIEFARFLTGDRQIRMVSAQATRYRPGQFLMMHNDKIDSEDRRFAYVINLTRRWQADWGGLLHFTDERGAVIDTLMPSWNALNIFRVPATHYVGLVSPWAAEPRFAITGWFRP
jgi:SM-20-related protein